VVNDIFKWEGEKSMKKYDIWFESFEKQTKAYVKRKTNEEIVKYSAMEYINSCLKYLTSEMERKLEYIHKNYHDKIDRVNHKQMIEENIMTMIKVCFNYVIFL
jgi:hypothetical protein